MSAEASSIPALRRMDRVLEFVKENQAAGFATIQKGLAMPKSSLHTLLKALVDLGYLRQRAEGAYVLGLRLYELGSRAVAHLDVKRDSLPFLYELRDRTGLTCHLGALDGGDAIYLIKLESRDSVSVRTWEGQRLSLHSSAVGKALLMDHDAEAIRHLWPEGHLEVYTANTIDTVERLVSELDAIRARGWAFDEAERLENIRCVAAPIRDVTGRIVAAVSVVGANFQMPDDRVVQLARDTMDVCARISQTLGYPE